MLWTYAPNGSVIDRREIGPDEIPEDMTNKELVPEPTTYSVSWQVTVEHDIDTRYPIGNGSFIAPVDNVATVDCRDPLGRDGQVCEFHQRNFGNLRRRAASDGHGRRGPIRGLERVGLLALEQFQHL